MKKLGFIFVLIFVLLIPFVATKQQVVFADNNSAIEINMLSEISPNGNYILARDIDYAGVPFTPITEFYGTLDGNGHKIKNLTITGTEGDLAVFAFTQNAKICNLQFENLNIVLTNTADTYASKLAFLVANANGTTIENISIVSRKDVSVDDQSNEVVTEYPSKITLSTVSSAYVGGIVAVANSGTSLLNCHCLCDMDISSTNSSKQLYYGGVCGYFDNSQALNMVESVNLILRDAPNNEFVGGMFGYCTGNKTEIKNCILTGSFMDSEDELFANSVLIPSFVGKIACPSSTPKQSSINYFYTSLEGDFVGNSADLEYYHTNGYIEYNVLEATFSTIDLQSLYLKNFYLDSTKFDRNKEFNFNQYWQITEKKTLPFLQHFSTFEFTLSEDESFNKNIKPNIGSNVIEFVSLDNTFKYKGQIVIGGYVTSVKNIDKFYKIVGLKKDGTTIFSNQRILNIILDEDAEVIEDGSTTTYKLHSDTVVATREQFNGNIGVIYNYNDSEITWGTFESSGNLINVYYINNCIMQDEGVYAFDLVAIEYNVVVRTENALHGTVRRDTAPETVKMPIVEDVIYYGQTLGYLADSTSDFAFSGWKNSLESEDFVETARRLIIPFNESAFDEGNILNGFSLESESFEFYATYTKQVCEIKILFAVNDEILDTTLSKIYINDREVSPDANGVISQKIKKGTECVISVTIPEKYEFTNWFLSDGKSNLGALSEQPTLTIQIDENEEQKIIVANLYQEKNPIANMGYIWWIIGGSVGGVALIGLAVFLIVRKRKDNSYKNMYL